MRRKVEDTDQDAVPDASKQLDLDAPKPPPGPPDVKESPFRRGRSAKGAFPDGQVLEGTVSKLGQTPDDRANPGVLAVDPTPHLGGNPGGDTVAVTRYRVVKDIALAHGRLRKDKVIDARSYDIADLIRRGVELEEVK